MTDAIPVQPAPLQPILATTRLLLRPMSDADAVGLHPVFADPDVMRFVDYPVSRDIGDTVRRIELWTIPLPEWHGTWTVRLAATDAIIGIVNFHHRETWNRRAEIGFVLARPYWGQGLMQEAMAALIAHCFNTLDMNRLEATIVPDNLGAIRLVLRLGFRCEGPILRERLLVGGQFRDVALYAMLKREWLAACGLPNGAPPTSPAGDEIIADPTGAPGTNLVSMPS